MDCGVPFCHMGCPLGNLIPDWNELVHRNRWHEALRVLHDTNNFPEFTGKTCPAPCEPSCVLALSGAAVTIKNIEAAIVDKGWEMGWIVPAPPDHETGKHVAIVGSGPAGMAAAQQLRRAGHAVTVFERDDRPGGLLTYGIPDFKMAKYYVQRRIKQLEAEGVRFVVNAEVGRNVDPHELREYHDALLLTVGATETRDLDIPGRHLKGVELAMPFLNQQNRRGFGEHGNGDAILATGKNVIIIGGGDTAADCLGTCHRHLARSVLQLDYNPRPPENENPETPWPLWPKILRISPCARGRGQARLADQAGAGLQSRRPPRPRRGTVHEAGWLPLRACVAGFPAVDLRAGKGLAQGDRRHAPDGGARETTVLQGNRPLLLRELAQSGALGFRFHGRTAPHRPGARRVQGLRSCDDAAGGHAPAAGRAWRGDSRVAANRVAEPGIPVARRGTAGRRLSQIRELRPQGLRVLRAYQQQYPSLDLLNTVFSLTLADEGPEAASELIKEELARNPTLLGLDRLLEAQLLAAPVERRHDLELVKQLVGQHIKRLGMYKCDHCGFRAKQYYWRCPGCGKWETYSPRRTETPDGYV